MLVRKKRGGGGMEQGDVLGAGSPKKGSINKKGIYLGS
jgi:hypothetical protein